MTIEDVARRLGIHRSTAYELAARDEFPFKVFGLGRRKVVSRIEFDRVLGVEDPERVGRATASQRT